MKLDLKQRPRTAVRRAVVDRLKEFPALRRVVATWRTWDGSDADRGDVAIDAMPAVMISPAGGDMAWYSPDARVQDLTLRIDLWTAGTDADDPESLWGALELALDPASDADGLALEARLRAAGAETGEVEFSPPALAPDLEAADGPSIHASGLVRIRVLSS